MGVETKIQWCQHTFNTWWGCQRVSPGCTHCYAESFAKRTGHNIWGPTTDRRFFGEKHWREPLKWDDAARLAGTRARVFCASMADVFEDRRDLDPEREKLWELIAKTKHLDWLLLTKRPENMLQLAPEDWREGWPANVWAGCTTEDQEHAELRLPHLLRVPAQVRFISAEPLLGPIDLSGLARAVVNGKLQWIDWCIIGGESGGGARPFDLAWARSLIRQCREDGYKPFFKQAGANVVDSEWKAGTWAQHDKRTIAAAQALHITGTVPNLLLLKDRKGGTLDELPEEFHVREFPSSAA